MARKFDEIQIDGGKRVRDVIVKIDHPSGKFEADMDGTTYGSKSYESLKVVLHAGAARHDELPYEAFYKFSLRYSFSVEAIAVSEPVVVEGVKLRYGQNEPEPERRCFPLSMDDDYSVSAPVNTGQSIDTLSKRDKELLVAVTPETTATVREFMTRLRTLDEEHKRLEAKQHEVNRARGAIVDEIKSTFGDSST
jgi:hypothetical protein